MKCTFVAIGAENISLEVLSAMLKQHGHETELAYDQGLFDDKNYLFMPRIARLFDQREKVVDDVVASKPDLVGFSVMTPTLTWALDIAARIKRRIDVPIIFGGMHPTTLPEQTITNDCVDMVCVGEGDYALAELCDSIDRGEMDTSIRNIWFKSGSAVIQNEQRPLVADLDTLPWPDKELFAPHVPIKNYYLAVTSRGCPYACTYCSLSFQAKQIAKLGGKRLRERSPESVVAELKAARAKYGFEWVDFRNNTFTANKKWVMRFLELYKAELGLPFKAFAHPSTMDREMAFALKGAGCFGIQLGVESYSEEVRKAILNRHETNAEVTRTCDAMDEAGLPYSIDYILGIPTQTETELLEAAEFFLQRKMCYRVSPFLLEYLPKLDIVKHGLAHGEITPEDVGALESGQHNHYLSTGSIGKDPVKLRFFLGYRFLFRLIPFLPARACRFLIRRKLFRLLPYLPSDVLIRFLDVMMLFRRHDRDAFTYAKNYAYWLRTRLRRRGARQAGDTPNETIMDRARPVVAG
ncbi:MAG: B12-binding domain-containing radical SAM protein [Phycisphaerae bacterium]|nr:B12-binding domain-containing radical SAM protein [Phycisphaerae bacterium]